MLPKKLFIHIYSRRITLKVLDVVYETQLLRVDNVVKVGKERRDGTNKYTILLKSSSYFLILSSPDFAVLVNFLPKLIG